MHEADAKALCLRGQACMEEEDLQDYYDGEEDAIGDDCGGVSAHLGVSLVLPTVAVFLLAVIALTWC